MHLHELVKAAGYSDCAPALESNGIDDLAILCDFDAAALASIGIRGRRAVGILDMAHLARFFDKEPSLMQYLPGILQKGVTSVTVLARFSEDELASLGVSKVGHRVKLRQCLKTNSPSASSWAAQQPLVAKAVKEQLEAVQSWVSADDNSMLIAKVMLQGKRGKGGRGVARIPLERTASGVSAASGARRGSAPQTGFARRRALSTCSEAGSLKADVSTPYPAYDPHATSLQPPGAGGAGRWARSPSVHSAISPYVPPAHQSYAEDTAAILDDDLAPPPLVQDSTFFFNEEIGRGSFGVVYKASSEQGSQYAIKVISLENEKAAYEAEQEYKLLVKLGHRNIVKVEKIYAGNNPEHQGEKAINIVMELVSGGELDRVMNECNNSIQALKGYAYQILNGLSYLHKLNIIHSDIKPKNIMIEAPNTLKLTDFGLSKVVTKGEGKGVAGRRCGGTLIYQSPNMVSFAEATTQSDIWAFACTVLELATSKRPWHEQKFQNDAQCILFLGGLQGTDRHPSLHLCHNDELREFLVHTFQAEQKRFECKDIFQNRFLSIDQPGVSALAEQLRTQI